MVDDLATLAADVKDQLVTFQAEFLREIFCSINDRRQNLFMVSLQMRDGLDMLLGNHQIMHRRRRLDIFERYDLAVFEGYGCRDFFPGDLAKQTIHKIFNLKFEI